MSARWEDTDAQIKRAIAAITDAQVDHHETQVALNDALRAMLALKRDHDRERPDHVLTHPGSGLPDDVLEKLDEPPEAR